MYCNIGLKRGYLHASRTDPPPADSPGHPRVELAHRLGVSKQSVSNWKSNNIQPSIELLEKIAGLFGVMTDHLQMPVEDLRGV